jgi:PAS domain S-box-containing protein
MATVDLRQSTIFSRLRGLLEVTRLLRTTDDLGVLLSAIAETVADSLAFRTVVVNVYRREWDDFVVTTVYGSDDARDALVGQVRQHSDWVPLLDARFLQRGAYLVPHGEFDWTSHAAYTPVIAVSDDPTAWHPEDALFVPMRTSDGELLGVLSVDEPVSGRRPSGDEIDVLVAVAEHAASAVQAAQEATRAKANGQALARLLDVSAHLNRTTDAHDLLTRVCEATSEALGFQKVAVQLLDATSRNGGKVAQFGFDDTEVDDPLAAEELDRLLRPEHDVEGCFLLTPEEALALLPSGHPYGYRSQLTGRGPHAWLDHWLLVPLEDARGHRIGYIWADDPIDRLCPDRERLRILRAFANLAMTALEQASHLEAVRAAGERRRAIIDASPVAIVDFDLQGRVRSWNDAATQMFGWTADEAIGRFSPIVPEEDAELFRMNIARIAQGETLRDLDLSRLRRGGGTIDVSTSAGPVRNAQGEIESVVSMMVDVSHRRAGERALVASEARKEAILRSSPLPLVIVDHAGLVAEMNPAAEETLGWTPGEISGRPFLDLCVAEEHRGELAAAIAAGSGPLVGTTCEVEALRSDGRTFASELRITRVEVPGDPLFAVSLADVSRVREREQRLSDAEGRYRTLVEQLPLATYVNEIGMPVRTTYMSPQIETMLGYPVEDWLRPDWFGSLLHPADRDRVLAALERTHVEGQPFKEEYRLRALDGRWIWVLDETTAVRDHEYRPIVLQGFLIDVTARRENDEALLRNEQLYRHVVETSHDLVVVVDADGSTRYASPRMLQTLGFTAEEIAEVRYSELVDPADMPAVRAYLERRLAGEEPAPPPAGVRRKDGTYVNLEGVISVLRDEHGEPTGYVSVARAIHRAALRPAAA